MCGRFVQTNTTIQRLQTLLPFDATNDTCSPEQPGVGGFNISPQKTVTVLSYRNEALLLDHMTWGITPKWAKQSFRQIINARSESIYGKRTFFSLVDNRIVIPADGFYEWQKSPIGISPKTKTPYFFQRSDGNPMLIAGIFDKSADPITGEVINRFVVLTTGANEAMTNYHDRMPVIIEESQLDNWFNDSLSEKDFANMTSHLPNDLLSAQRVSNKVNSPQSEGPELIAPAQPIDLSNKTLFDNLDV